MGIGQPQKILGDDRNVSYTVCLHGSGLYSNISARKGRGQSAIYFTFSPLCLDFNEIFNCRINLIPFVYLLDYENKAHMIFNVFGNILMFVPTGILLPVLYKRLDKYYKVIGTGFLISLAIEILQLPFADRTSDVDDLLMNTLGVATGYVLYMIVRYAKNLGKQKASLSGGSYK